MLLIHVTKLDWCNGEAERREKRGSGERSEMRESQARACTAVLILSCHLVVTGAIIQRENASELEIGDPAKMTGLT